MLRALVTAIAVAACTTQLCCNWAAADAGKNQTLNANGVKISYSVQGEGEPVILIHGLASSGSINWDLPGTTALLAKKYQVITYDGRGHGLSDKPATEDAYGPELVEDVVRLMDHLKIKKAHLVGYSMGGIVTAKFMAKHQDRVLSGTLGGMGWLRDAGIAQKAFQALGKDSDKPVSICARSLGKLALTEEEIKSIKVPVTILVGGRDEMIKKLYVDPLTPVRKDWPVVEIDDANHLTCIAKKQFKEEIEKWLDKQKAR